MSIMGFTGTRENPTPAQLRWMWKQMEIASCGPSKLRHGCCVGSDYAMHLAAVRHRVRIICHPPDCEDYLERACLLGPMVELIEEPQPYLVRNHDIVNGSDELLATPKEHFEVLRSGTWATIRYARQRKIPIQICYPDGTVKREQP